MDTIGLIGTIASVVSLGYAIHSKIELTKLKEHQISNLRRTLKEAIVAMSHSYKLMDNPGKYGITNPEAIKRITATHISTTSVIRQIFSDLSKLDLPYDNRKLNGYVTNGLITSTWVWQQALTYADAPDSFTKPNNLPEDTPDWFAAEKTNGVMN